MDTNTLLQQILAKLERKIPHLQNSHKTMQQGIAQNSYDIQMVKAN